MIHFIFDATFEGLLTAIFDKYYLREGNVRLFHEKTYQPEISCTSHRVVSDTQKAGRVWDGLKKKLSARARNTFFCAYLSEDIIIHRECLAYACYIFENPPGAEHNLAHPSVLSLLQAEKKVSRERHRMKAFVRFSKTADNIYYAPIEPDFNVLPLVATFFRERFADQQWLIYDVKRKYGLFYNLQSVNEVTFETTPTSKGNLSPGSVFATEEELVLALWKDYFKNTTILARKNLSLHIRHVPKRYWKYLSEKQ